MSITLAKLIKEARLRVGLTQADLGTLVGTSMENVAAIENGRNRQPSPKIIYGLTRSLDIFTEDIYAAIAGTLNHLPWERVGDLDLKDIELELMFRQVDNLLNSEARDRVKSFIRFTLDEERKRLKQNGRVKRQRKDTKH